MSQARCIHGIIEAQAALGPSALALVSEAEQLDYRTLCQRARQVAHALRALGVGPEVRVGLVADRSIEMIVGLLGILLAGGAYVPLDPAHPAERLAFLASDAGIRVLLAHERWLAHVPAPGVPTLCFDRDRAQIDACSAEPLASDATAQTLAYVIHTSGSTGAPKGVMIEHGGVADLIAAQRQRFGAGSGSRVLQLASLGFDASLWELVMALASGAALHLAPADALLPGPGLVALLAARAITHLTITPSALAALPDAALPALSTLIVAGEPCPVALAQRWGAGRRFFNAYGPTEVTVCATVHAWTQGDATLPIGLPLPHARVSLRDAEGRPVAPGEVGELWLGGSAVARGYLGRPELSAARFFPDPAQPGARLYRSGDLARELPGGALCFVGRVDEQVKIRGVRVEPAEIQARLAEHPAVREAVVTSREDRPGERYLVAHVALRSPLDAPARALRRFLAERLPRALVPRALVIVDDFARTPSGKVDRAALPAPRFVRPEASLDPVLPRSPEARALAALWSEVLAVSPIAEDDDFFELGGDSLSAARIAARARALLGVDLPASVVLEARTLAALAARLASPSAAPSRPALALPARSSEGALPLSFAQQRLWFLHQADPASSAYNLPAALRLRGPLDVPALERALAEIVQRHEALRTTFALVNGEPAQIITPAALPPLPVHDLRALAPPDRERALAELTRETLGAPFDLARGPLLRARLVHVDEAEHLLLLGMHHIVSDGWSMSVLVRELAALHQAFAAGEPSPLAPLPLQYADHARAQREALAPEALAAGLDFFRRALAGAPRVHALPLDRPRPSAPTHRGAQLPVLLSPALCAGLDALAEATGATRFMVLLAAFDAWLHRESGSVDLVVGTPVLGRDRPELEGLIGFFAGTLALRVTLFDDPSFRTLIERVRARALAAYVHQHVPFEKVVEELRPARDTAHHPLFQLMFALQEPPPRASAGALSIDFTELDAGASPFDLLLQLHEEGGALTGTLDYASELFDRPTIERWMDHLRALITEALRAPDQPLSTLPFPVAPPPRRPLAQLEAALLEDPSLDDCAVRALPVEGAPEQLTAWIVERAPAPTAQLLARLAERHATLSLPTRVVRLSTLPITTAGQVDEHALLRVAGSVPLPLGIPLPDGRGWERGASRGLDRGSLGGLDRGLDRGSLGGLDSGAPSFADGGPLLIPESAPTTLVEALLRAATSDKGLTYHRPDHPAESESYASLLTRALRILGGLQQSHLRPGDRVILQIEALDLHFASFWACLLGGFVPLTVAIAPSYESENGVNAKLHNAWTLLGEPVVLAGGALVGPLRGLGALYPRMRGLRVLVAEELAELPPAAQLHTPQPDDLAFLQLSSGSTGVPKCIQETHRAVIRHIHGSQQHNGYRSDDVSLNWLPLDHVVPILTCHLKDVYLCTTQIQVQSHLVLADPLAWLDLCEAHRVTHSWSPNFGFKLVADAARAAPERRWDLSAIKALMNAGEQVTLPVAREFLAALAPSGLREQALQPAFGMAEVCTCMTYSNDFTLQGGVHWVDKASLQGALDFLPGEREGAIAFVDLGPPIPGVQIRIADEKARVVPEGTIGRLHIKGGVTTPGYLDNPAANQEAFPGEGWFDSGDLGFMRNGRLTLTGREKEMINVRGAKYLCYEVEDVAGGVPGVLPTFVAACAVEDQRGGTEGLALFFVPRDPAEGSAIARAIGLRVASSLGIAPSHVVALARADFPKTTSGKIQRAQLKRELAEGRHRDARGLEPVASAGLFHQRIWRARAATGPEASPRTGTVLVFLDGRGLGERLADTLGAGGRRCVRVEHGASFATLGGDRYRADPASLDHMERLLALPGAGDPPVDEILHLWSYDGPPSPTESPHARAVHGLLALARALGQRGEGAGSLRLTVISTGAQSTRLDEPAAGNKALLLGLVQTLPEEQPSVDCRHLDLEGQDLAADAERVLGELTLARRAREIAHRGELRLEPRLVPVTLPPAPPALVEGGAYLISGGLGGLGALLAGALLAQRRAQLLLLGRTALGADPVKEARYQALVAAAARAGGSLRYEVADVAEAKAVEAAVARAEASWGKKLDGAFHLAGALGERLLAEESAAGFEATLRPKLRGGLALAEVLRQRPGALFVSFSSVNGALGGFAAGAYAAASRFQEQHARALQQEGVLRAHCLAFSLWDDLGMSAGNERRSAAEARGLRALSADEGLGALLAALGSEPGCLFVGLDARRPAILRHGVESALLPEQVARSAAPLMAVVPPRTEIERRIAALWGELLGLREVGIHHNFFELGGHSLLLARVRARLREAFGRDVPILEMFRHPTVSALAAHLARGEEQGLGRAAIDERAQRQLAARARRRPEPPARKTTDG
jgi:amino acid adenylation domain-containing protein